MFLKISPTKRVIRFGAHGKLSSRYIGSFEILERVGEVAYRLALPPSLEGVHNVFHVSQLRRYIGMRAMYWIIQSWSCSQTCHILSNQWLLWTEVSRP